MERYDLAAHRGATFSRTIRLEKGGTVLDLTGWTAKAQVRPEPDAPTLICEMDVTVIPAEGKVKIRIPAEVTAEIPQGVYAWDIRMTDAEGESRYYLGGAFKALPSVTK